MQQQPNKKSIKTLLCQITPQYKDKPQTVQTISKSLQLYKSSDNIDLIAFPQLAFVGYNFEDKQDALPYAVKSDEGVDFAFAKDIALRLKSYVTFGYIEKDQVEGGWVLYNSAAVIDREGKTICNYRKNHLYYNDKLWARQGSGFTSFQLSTCNKQTIKCTLALSTDIHPKQFTSGQFELANYVVHNKSDILLLLASWSDSEKQEIHSNDVTATYSYWIHRLKPLVGGKTSLFLVSDRVGKEYDYFAKKIIRFYGSSCAIMFNPTKVIKNLDANNQGYLMIQTFLQR